MKQIGGWVTLAVVIGIVLAVLALMSPSTMQPGAAAADIPYSQFRSLVEKGNVAELVIRGNVVNGKLTVPEPIGPQGKQMQQFRVRIPSFGDPRLLPLLEEKKVTYRVAASEGEGGIGRTLIGILPWVLFIALYWWFWRRMSSGGMPGGLGGRGVDRFLEGSSHEEVPTGPPVTFKDVAGQDNAKREVAELLEFLRHPETYTEMGAEVPHGVLLMGPPGTGKTLLARALAGEAEVPFFSISASEFIEMFVGVGASRVRNMFAEARKRAPSIIFIDELDSVGRVRGTGLGGGHDEREQTLNQILAEMDGFTRREAVIVLAATNRPDVLDPALLRPGRFDRHVTLDLPDQDARLAILKVHAKKVPVDDDVDFVKVAAGTPGFSGADLKNLINEAAMMAAREKVRGVSMHHLDAARERILMGSERTLVITPDEQHRLAVHESGHTTVAHFLPNADPLYKVTIIPRGRALGATHQLPEEERYTLPEAYLKDRLAVMLGGRAAEKTLLNSVSSGADDDIRQATALAKAMVSRWGMSDDVGPMDVRESDSHPFLGMEMAQPRHFSEATAEAVDHAVRDLVVEAENRAVKIIEDHRPAIERLIAALKKQETLDRAAIDDCLGAAVEPAPPPRAAAG